MHNRKNLWKDIKNCATGTQEPWIVIRDFNNVIKVEDRIWGNNVQEVECADLEHMMEEIGLFEQETTGKHFTWSNGQTNGMI